MKRPLISDSERERLNEVDKKRNELDWEFITRVVAHLLLKMDMETRVEAILNFVGSVEEVYDNAIKRLLVDCIEDERLTIDQSMDVMRDLLQAERFIHIVGKCIEHAAEPTEDNPGDVGVLTPNATTIVKIIEEARIMCVRALGMKRSSTRS